MTTGRLRWDDLPGDDVSGAIALLRTIRRATPGSRLTIKAGSDAERHLAHLHRLGLLDAVPASGNAVSSFQFHPRKGTPA